MKTKLFAALALSLALIPTAFCQLTTDKGSKSDQTNVKNSSSN